MERRTGRPTAWLWGTAALSAVATAVSLIAIMAVTGIYSSWPLLGVLVPTVVLTVIGNLRIGALLSIPVVVVPCLLSFTIVAVIYDPGGDGQLGLGIMILGFGAAVVSAITSALTTIVKLLTRTRSPA